MSQQPPEDKLTAETPKVEEQHESEELEFSIDHALNKLAMDTLMFMDAQVQENKHIPESERPYVMLHAAEAITFNIIMHIAEQTNTSAQELAEKTKANLMEAVHHLMHELGQDCSHLH